MRTRFVACYRLQLQPQFGFDAAAGIVPYLDRLGVSHMYCSPCLQAVPGSTHGYDVIDPTRVSADLGGEPGFRNLCEALEKAGMGLVLDLVPNHMAIGHTGNTWWWDVLQNGPASVYSRHFDVDWEPPEKKLRNLILLPILGDRYGRILDSREIRIFREGGEFTVRYHEHTLPVEPRSMETLLSAAADRVASDELAFLAGAFGRLPLPTQKDSSSVERRHRDKAVLFGLFEKLCLERPNVASAIDTVLEDWHASPELMDAFLQSQNYRVAYWRNADRELGYRRFFDINSLVALRVEDKRVFQDTHRLVLDWAELDVVDGFRIDHVDGLRYPSDYLNRLRVAAPKAWIVVEKILQPGETLPENWPVAGTTGYEFLNLLTHLFLRPEAEKTLTQFYHDFTGEPEDFHAVAKDCKLEMLRTVLGSDLNRLTTLLLELSDERPASWDFTRHELHQALREILTEFAVYRTYVTPDDKTVSERDKTYIREAVQSAIEHRPDLDPGVFTFIEEILLANLRGFRESEFVLRFQQLSSVTLAKGVEDTAFYRFNRFVALNEVGGAPERFGATPAEFHRACAEGAKHRPQSMLTTSTHDTKRSEDVRARLVLLSEAADRWCETVIQWSKHNERYKSGEFPDRNAEYLLYQTLVGAWPISSERVSAYMEKAAREAKQFTSWTDKNDEYERSLADFIARIYSDREFIAGLEAFVSLLVESGRANSLAQLLLKLTAPGVPDIYQGTELWNFRLVDPDNRGTIDFNSLAEIYEDACRSAAEPASAPSDSGALKMWIIEKTLAARRANCDAFGEEGSYRPLEAEGGRSDRVVAFIRGEKVVTVVSRWPIATGNDWAGTTLTLPPGRWRSQFDGRVYEGGRQDVGAVLAHLPVSLLAALP